MSQIIELPSELTAKIAAGEVIERPAYAVKELIENALDAQASTIYIEVVNAGLDKIIVVDDGLGMNKEDLLISFLPHTTSKIKDEDDLGKIKSLGFRGEALSSIASISQLTIQSKTQDNTTGTKVVVTHSSIEHVQPIGMPNGTKVVVENLFGNVPVRKKFLKSTRTEFRAIIDLVTDEAMGHPTIGFELVHNDKSILKLPKNQPLTERITMLLGGSLVDQSVPFTFEESYMKTNGFIGKPQLSFSTHNKLFFLINSRRVYDPLLVLAVKDAYGNLLERQTFPFGIVNIQVPYEVVDVNVHPRKEQVKFTDPQMIATLLGKAISESLQDNNLTFYNINWKQGLTKTPVAKSLRKTLSKSDIAQLGKVNKDTDIAQIHNLYLIVETSQGMMLIDQHAAHEAILFDELKNEYLKLREKDQSIELSSAIFIELSIAEMQVLEEFEEYFQNLGFVIEEFGQNTIKVSAVPKFFQDFDLRALFAEILADFVNQEFPKTIDDRSYRMLAYLACRNAIKSGESLSQEQRLQLIKSLDVHHYTYTCPHGRPVKIEFSLREIDRIFKRS